MDVFKLIASLTLNTDDYEESLRDAESKGSKLGSALSTAAKVGGAAVAAASTAVVAFGKSAVDAGQSFDASMSQVAATMGYSTEALNTEGSEAAETFNKLREFAQKMGSETAFSATEAADALNYMALAGYDADTSISMLPNVLNLAAAGGMELAAASDMITDGQSALGLSIEETTELVDKMARASSKSNTSVEQLGSAMLTIGGTAKSLSGGTTELATALGILADNGVKGSEGGTALRNILTAIQGDKFEETFGKMGISAYDAQGNLRALKDVFYEMEMAMDGMTTQQRTEIINNTFNARDLKNINALLATTTERWDELSSAIDDSKDAAQNMAEVQLDNLTGDITLFQSALEGAKIAVSDKLTPTLRKFVSMASEGISNVTKAFKEKGLDGAMDALGDWLGDALGLIIDSVPKIVSAGSKLVQSFVKGLVKNLPKIADAAVAIVSQLAADLSKFLPKIIPAAVDAIITIVDTLIDNLPLLIQAGVDLMVGLGKGLTKALPKIINKIPEIISGIVNAFVQEWPAITKAVSGLVNTDIGQIVEVIIGYHAVIKGLKIVKGIKDIYSSLKNLSWLMSNPVVAAVGGLIALFVGLQKSFENELQSEYGLTEQQKKIIEKAEEITEAYADMDSSRRDSMTEVSNEYGYIRDLVTEYNGLLDADGKVKEGYEKRAEFIKTTLAESLGVERDEIDKLIEKNGELGRSIDILILKKQAEATLNANEAAYQESKQNQKEALQTLIEAQNTAKEAEEKYQKTIEESGNALEYYNGLLKGSPEAAKDFFWANRELIEGQKVAKQAYDEASEALQNAEEAYVGYSSTIDNYEGLRADLIANDEEAIRESLLNLQEGFISARTGTEETLRKQVEDQKAYYRDLVQASKDGSTVVTQEMIDAAWEMVRRSSEALDDYLEKHKETYDGVVEDAKSIKVPLSEAANENAYAFYSQIGTNTNIQKTKAASGKLKNAAVEGANGYEEMKAQGLHAIDGYLVGLNDETKKMMIRLAAKGIVRASTEAAHEELDARSPSRVWERELGAMAGEGYIIGLSKKVKPAVDMAKKFVDQVTEAAWNQSESKPLFDGFDLGDIDDRADELSDIFSNDDDIYGEDVCVTTATIPDQKERMFEVPRYSSPQYLNLTIDIGGQKIKTVLYELMQEETNRVGLRLVRGTV